MHAFLTISRPRFWVYLLGPYVLGAVAALHAGESGYLLGGLLWGLYFTLPANALIYGVNDLFDRETDAMNEKKQGYETVFDPSHRRRFFSFLIFLHLPFFFFIPLLSFSALFFSALFLFLGIFYSAPPLRFKVRPFLDSLSNVLYVLPGCVAYAAFGGSHYAWPLVVAAGLWAMAMHAYSAVPDIVADTRAGIATIATVLGGHRTLLMCLGLYVLSGVLTAWMFHPVGLLGVLTYSVLMLVSLRAKNHAQLFAVYRIFPLVNTLMGAVLFFAILFQ